jgi:hypothetical protein
MAILKLKIKDVNSSAQVGDIAYYCKLNEAEDGFTTGGFNTANYNEIVRIGPIAAFIPVLNEVRVTVEGNFPLPGPGDYVFFSKDNKVNTGDLKGYFSTVKFVNNSNSEAELFQITMNVEQSSK